MSEKCWRCFRPLESCYCNDIVPVETGVTFVFLMHPKEAYKQKTGTGRLSALSLPPAEIIIGVDFTQNNRVNALIADTQYFPVLLYPGDNAISADDPELPSLCHGKRLLVFVVDATWFCAKKMMHLSTNLQALPRLSFRNGYRSQFTFKHQPRPECLSTIESCYYLILGLQQSGAVAAGVNPEPLMTVFRKMVSFQLESQKRREESGEPDRYVNSRPRSKHGKLPV